MRELFRRAFVSIFVAATLLGCSATAQKQERSERQKVALAMFNERCTKSGEFIYRTVDDVEGILLMKIRPDKVNYGDQFELDDPYGSDLLGKGYIKSFLRGSFEAGEGKIVPTSEGTRGYLFVEAVDPLDGVRYRYTGEKKAVGQMDANSPNVKFEVARNPKFDLTIYGFVVDRIPATGPGPRYGITFDDISTRNDREFWIAGSSLRVIDLQTNELIAERIGYMVDVFQGSKEGGRSPWLLAADHACPAFGGRYGALNQSRQADRFVEKALRPKH